MIEATQHALTTGIPMPMLPSTTLPLPMSRSVVASDPSRTFAAVLQEQLAPSADDNMTAEAAELQATEAEPERIADVARQLESLLLYTLLKQMWATVPEETLLGTGLAGQFYREMWLEALADDITSAGSGIGLATVLERDIATLTR